MTNATVSEEGIKAEGAINRKQEKRKERGGGEGRKGETEEEGE